MNRNGLRLAALALLAFSGVTARGDEAAETKVFADKFKVAWVIEEPPQPPGEAKTEAKLVEEYVNALPAVKSAVKNGKPALVLFTSAETFGRPAKKTRGALGTDSVFRIAFENDASPDFTTRMACRLFECVKLDMTAVDPARNKLFNKDTAPAAVVVRPDGTVAKYWIGERKADAIGKGLFEAMAEVIAKLDPKYAKWKDDAKKLGSVVRDIIYARAKVSRTQEEITGCQKRLDDAVNGVPEANMKPNPVAEKQSRARLKELQEKLEKEQATVAADEAKVQELLGRTGLE